MVKLLRRFRPGRKLFDEVNRLIAEGDAANREQDWASAARLYGRALELDQSRGPIHVQLGHSLKEQGHLRRAVQSYRKAAEMQPRDADTQLQLGHALKLQGRLTEAAEAYARAKALDACSADIDREYVDTARYRTLSAQRPVAPDAGQRSHELQRAELLGILEEADFPGHLIDLFDHRFYFFSNPELASEGMADPATCLRHFCWHGVERLRAVAPDCGFDAAFYLRTYAPGLAFSPVEAYRHWLTIGLSRGWAPNRRKRATTAVGTGVSADIPDDLLEMIIREPDRSSWPMIYDRALVEQEAGRFEPALVRRVFETMVDRLLRGDGTSRRVAFELLQRLMQHEPSPWIRVAYADDLLERGCELEAERVYRREIERGDATDLLFFHSASCLERLGQWSDALGTALQGRHHCPGDPGLSTLVERLAAKVIQRSWSVASAADEHRIGDAQQRLAQTVAEVASLTAAQERLPPRRIRRVAIVGNQDLDQCRFYRIEQKLEQLLRAGFEVELFDQHTGLQAFKANVQTFDAAIFYRVPAFFPIIQAIGHARELGLATFYEIDDLIFESEHYPTSLASYGGQISQPEYVGLAMGVPLFAAAMQLCEFGIASTPTLAAAMARRVSSGRVFVHRNAFGSKHEAAARRPMTRPEGEAVTLFYGSGTKAHKEDFQRLVEPALHALVQRYGARISIVLAGYVTLSDALLEIRDNLVLRDVMPIEAFWEMLPEVDINLAVLLPSVMADAKSEIKWMEAAMFGVPSVVSDTATFREVIEPGVTGFLCGSPEEWTATLDRLVNDATLRRAVGVRAREVVHDRYRLDAAAANIAEVMRQVDPPIRPKRPKIVVVNVFYPPVAIGGATRVVHDNVRQIAVQYGEEFDIEVVTTGMEPSAPYTMSSYAWDGIKVTRIAAPDMLDIDLVVDDPAMGAAFDAFIRQSQPDLIHFHCIQRLTVAIADVALRRGVPYVITVHDGWWISSEQFLVDEALRLERYAFDEPSRTLRDLGPDKHARMEALRPALFGALRVLAVSTSFADLYRNCGVPNVVALANGVSTDIAPRPRSAGSGKVRLGFIGGLERHKGVSLIQAALASTRFEHLSLLVVDHAMRPGEHRREAWGDLAVDIVPKRPQSRVADLYAEIDVLLAPSIWPESYGLVTREALQAGCWVVASDRGSIGEDVIEGENGFTVSVASMQPLRDALTLIDRDPARFSHRPARRPRLRTSADQADDLAALYHTLLGERASLAS